MAPASLGRESDKVREVDELKENDAWWPPPTAETEVVDVVAAVENLAPLLCFRPICRPGEKILATRDGLPDLVRTVRCHSKSPRGVAAQPLHLDGNSSKKVDAGRNTQRGLRKLGAKKLPISTRNSDLSDKRFPTSKLGEPVEDRDLAEEIAT